MATSRRDLKRGEGQARVSLGPGVPGVDRSTAPLGGAAHSPPPRRGAAPPPPSRHGLPPTVSRSLRICEVGSTRRAEET